MESPSTKDIQGTREAYSAGAMSDHSTQVGAACGVGFGYNKAYDEDTKDVRIHAEVHALLRNAQRGVETEGRTMYAPWASCPNCAMCIVSAGIAKVVVHHERMQLTPPHWQGEVEHGLHILQQHGVPVVAVSMVFGVRVKICGNEVNL